MKSLLSILESSVSGENCIIKLEKWYDVYEELDKTEGRGGRKLKFRTQNKKDALELSKDLGCWGSDGVVQENLFLKIILCHSYEGNSYLIPLGKESEIDSEAIKKANLVASAMSKLSIEEIRALRS